MRRLAIVAAVCLAGPALAQSEPTVVVPPAPVLTPAPAAPIAPSVANPSPPNTSVPGGQTPGAFGQTPSPAATPPANGDTGATSKPATATMSTGQAGTGIPPDAAAPVSNDWLPAGSAVLGVLDKVEGSTKKITIPAGGQATVGDMVVSVQSCLTRPASELPDAAVFLSVQPAGDDSGATNFHGWMIRSAPGATVVGDAGETFRVIGCS